MVALPQVPDDSGPGPQGLSEAFDAFIGERTVLGVFRPITARKVGNDLRQLVRELGDPPLCEVTRDVVLGYLAARPWAPSTVRRTFSRLAAFFAWALERGLIDASPLAGVKPSRPPRTLPRGLRVEETRTLVQRAPDYRAQLIVSLMAQEGLRRAEVAQLSIDDLDLVERMVFVNGKGGHERLLPLSEETLSGLRRYLADHPATSGPLIRSYQYPTRPITPDHISRIVAEWMYAAGVKRAPHDGRSPHALRHTCATDMLRAGAHIRDVQRALGHTSLATTETYLPLVVDDLRSAMSGRRYSAE